MREKFSKEPALLARWRKRKKYDYFKDAGNHLLKLNIHSKF